MTQPVQPPGGPSAGPLPSRPAIPSGDRPTYASAEGLTTTEARRIAHEAYRYAYPMLMAYGLFHNQAFQSTSSMHQGMNRLHHFRQLGGPRMLNSIPWINNDTPYGAGWLDLRAEPFVLHLPEFPPQRFHNVQLIDLFTHNFAFYGTRLSGNAATSILIAGPDWQQPVPAGIAHVARAETRFVKLVTRILLEGGEEAADVRALEDGYRLEPLSAFTGMARAPAPPALAFPVPAALKFESRSAAFIGPFNFLLALCELPPEEAPTFERFARIGIAPGMAFDAESLPAALRAAIDAGAEDAHAEISDKAARLGERVNGWEMPLDLRGNRARMACDAAALLRRAAAAMYAIWGIDAEEGLYMVADVDAEGQPLDGGRASYALRFDAAPPVHAFWSITVYDAKTRLLVAHSSGRYAVRDRDTGLQRGADDSLTLVLQHDPVAHGPAANWLPVPRQPFQLVARLYWPRAELLDGRFRPPPVRAIG